MMAENKSNKVSPQMQGVISEFMGNSNPKQVLQLDSLNKLKSDDCETKSWKNQGEVTLTQQAMEIIVAPTAEEARVTPIPSPRVDPNLITSAKGWVPPRYVVNPEDDKRILTMRTEELVGKTITGTFFMKDQEPYVKHWIRWNEKKADNIFVPKALAHSLFNGQPKSGAKVSTTITAVGPGTVSAWQMHPQCESFHIIRMPLYDTDYSKKAAETLKARREQLLGRTVTGTFFMRQVDSQTMHYIRWNDKRADNVLVQEDVVRDAFRGNPVSGAKVCATITTLGPKGVSPWRMNPMCEKIAVVKKWSPKPARNLLESIESMMVANHAATETESTMLPSPSSRWSRSPANLSRSCPAFGSPLSRRIAAGSESIWSPNNGLSFVGYQRRRNRWANTPSSGSASPQTRSTSPAWGRPPFTNKVYARSSRRVTPVVLGSAFAKRNVLEL
jgi:hypothetical protein